MDCPFDFLLNLESEFCLSSPSVRERDAHSYRSRLDFKEVTLWAVFYTTDPTYRPSLTKLFFFFFSFDLK